jgi:protein CpxP
MIRSPIFALCLGTYAIAFAAPIAQANPNFSNLNNEQLAQNTPRPKPVKRGDLMEELNLSNSQKRQMAAIRQKYQGQMTQLRDRMRTSQEEMASLMANSSSESAIRAKHREISGLREQLGNLRLDSMLEMRQVLTPEQRNQFSQLMKERRPHARQGQGQGRPPVPPDEVF